MHPDDGRMILNFITQALSEGPLGIYGDGTQTRSVQYEEGLVEGALGLMRSEETRPVNLGNPVEYSVHGVAELVPEISGSGSVIRYETLPGDDPRQGCPKISLAREVLRWEPWVPTEEGLRLTLQWFAGRRERTEEATTRR
jgi:dTDP-glucose 4,6-dehydratase